MLPAARNQRAFALLQVVLGEREARHEAFPAHPGGWCCFVYLYKRVVYITLLTMRQMERPLTLDDGLFVFVRLCLSLSFFVWYCLVLSGPGRGRGLPGVRLDRRGGKLDGSTQGGHVWHGTV